MRALSCARKSIELSFGAELHFPAFHIVWVGSDCLVSFNCKTHGGGSEAGLPVLIEQGPPPMRLRDRKVSVTSRLAGEAHQEFLSKQSDHILKAAAPRHYYIIAVGRAQVAGNAVLISRLDYDFSQPAA